MKGKYKFWTPESGVIGGIVFGLVLVIIISFLFQPVWYYLAMWADYWK